MKQYALMSFVLAGCALFYGKVIFSLFLMLPALRFLFSIFWRLFPAGVRRFFNRDLRGLLAIAKITYAIQLNLYRNLSVAGIFERTVKKHPNKAVFKTVLGDGTWTFQQLDEYANQVANLFQSEGHVKKGDCVALIATSCPQYVGIWLGLNKLGCITALINYNLKVEALSHSITIAQSKVVIVAADLLENFSAIKNQLKNVEKTYVFHEGNSLRCESSLPNFDEAVARMPKSRPVVKDPVGYFDKVVYIYTSGTTGLPNVLLCTLPLYHSAGGLACVGQAIVMGVMVVLRKSFSASKFWDDVNKYHCTAFHYIGELCRYLLTQPPKLTDPNHSLRVIYGVGLRASVWQGLISRFKIPRILEAYGSTEGNVGFVNVDGKIGAVGYTSWMMEYFRGMYLIKVDTETGKVVRDEKGRCIRCGVNEPGELIGRITRSKVTGFDGYVQKDATEKKVLRDVIESGDRYFRTGDVFIKDREGYVVFLDRIGDTFRWKGENVSTTEVEGVISVLVNNADVGVFGVEVPGCEGKAGMACLSGTDLNTDIQQLSQSVQKRLPVYARPLFLRFQTDFEVTGTFKVMKSKLREAGFDPKNCGQDHLYYWDLTKCEYRRLNSAAYQQIISGNVRY